MHHELRVVHELPGNEFKELLHDVPPLTAVRPSALTHPRRTSAVRPTARARDAGRRGQAPYASAGSCCGAARLRPPAPSSPSSSRAAAAGLALPLARRFGLLRHLPLFHLRGDGRLVGSRFASGSTEPEAVALEKAADGIRGQRTVLQPVEHARLLCVDHHRVLHAARTARPPRGTSRSGPCANRPPRYDTSAFSSCRPLRKRKRTATGCSPYVND